jgi:hypothetical protein
VSNWRSSYRHLLTFRRDATLQVYEETVLNIEDLPADLGLLFHNKEWDVVPVAQPTWENVWDPAAGDDIRSGQVGLVPLTDKTASPADVTGDLDVGKLKAALKVRYA